MKDRLTEMRKQAKLSQQDLADKLFVSRSTVSRWENGELTPSIANLKEMAKLYGVSLDYLCGSDEPTRQETEGQLSIEMVEPCDADSTRHQRWWDIKFVKRIIYFTLSLLLILLSMGCVKAGHLDEKTSNGGEYLANVLSGEISEMKFIGGGETITLTDGQEIASAVARMEQFDVVRSEDTDIKAPGAASICVIFQYTNDTEKRITFPCFTVDDVTYKALCDGEGVYYQQLEPVVHWPFYQEEEP